VASAFPALLRRTVGSVCGDSPFTALRALPEHTKKERARRALAGPFEIS